MKSQKRLRRVAMSPSELNAFLAEERTCRIATVNDLGPHITPMWFVWDGCCLWISSQIRTQRWIDITRRPGVAVMIDAGTELTDLRGAEFIGDAEVVGEVPRAGTSHPDLVVPEKLFADKYFGSYTMDHDGKHAWLRIRPSAVRSWDLRKAATL
ncbi:pyridoxamine 5'-phosphate oxidase family protein [Nocardia nova]|uniref:pyridoxamine 5'-phosphate oxidase family protein n=1 Tax=Nocardia nova TaxID=37330 RepID=UPI00370FD072